MSVAYVDTSCLVAVAFAEPPGPAVSALLESYDGLLSSNLLEAELLAALKREQVTEEPPFLSAIAWVLPDRPLGADIRRVLEQGHVRGADLWHLAAALYVAEDPDQLPFLTLDKRQRERAAALGFPVPAPDAPPPPPAQPARRP